jgi:hypothetical protein
MSGDDQSLEELREATDKGSRIDEAGGSGRDDLVDDVVEQLAAFDDPDRQKTLSVWDEQLAPLVAAIESDPDRLASVVDDLAAAYDGTAGVDGDPERSDVLRLALRVGLQEAAPETLEALRKGMKERAGENI